MSAATDPGTPRRFPWMRILLIVSLALNFLVIGLVAGAVMRFGGSERVRDRTAGPLGAVLFRELPSADRRALWNELQGTPRERRDRRRAEIAALTAALKTRPFDKTALNAVLDDHAAGRNAWLVGVQNAWMERVAAMGDDERAAYADRLQKALTDGRKRKPKGN